jgi:putative tryptophan/tyrosine transport system substrate-binding protein
MVMNRRAFVTGLGAVIVAPIPAGAEQTGKVWRIGFISVTHTKVENVFFQQLRELGYVEGQNLVVERRYSEGRADRFPEFAAELVRLNVDMIVVTTTPAGLAAKKATKTIPIVQANSIDPVGVGLVASLARPVQISPAQRSWRLTSVRNDCSCSWNRSRTSPQLP